MLHKSNLNHSTIIIGGGLTGISAALHLKHPYLLFEQESRLGGLARTEERDGFFFDYTGHWLHLRDTYAKDLVNRHAEKDLQSIPRKAKVYSNGTFIRYPFQANVHGLPSPVIYECLLGYIESLQRRNESEPRNFEQYILHHFGSGIARHFMIPYNSKLWGVHPREITSAWCQRFVPIPTVEQMVAGAIGVEFTELGYNTRFLYPKQGGIEALTSTLVRQLDNNNVILNTEIEAIDPQQHLVYLGDETISYRTLINTMPLPELLKRIRNLPEPIEQAAARLRCSSVSYLNIASRQRPPEDYHWVYVPEENYPFYRVGAYSNAMPSMAPPGCTSLYVELSGRETIHNSRTGIGNAVRALVDIKAIRSPEDVIFADAREIKYAYVIFDEYYEESLRCIMPYLEQNQIFSRGRYGSWIYNSMEDSILEGREVALKINTLAPNISSE